ncbi:Hypothetical protein R9X50_00432300 [Acrodontium crateriforme]|uniref:Uncharacterized protein n=1 Tax=Acrodontium crateriforme TaxID=150365 RepID=A0AAQ3M5X3_9PEZI|nr:Hypothetical protein R9X50_00432300 [Acrodontium crateriforme]
MSISEDLARHERPPQAQRPRKDHTHEREMEQGEVQDWDYAQARVSHKPSPLMIHGEALSEPPSLLAHILASPPIAITRRDEWFRAGSITPKYPSPSDEHQDFARGESPAVKGFREDFVANAPSFKSPTTASLDAQNSGLPPTPPTVEKSDESPREDSLSPNPQFADAVRNALRSEKSGVSTPTGRLLAAQTPGPSPPSRDERSVKLSAPESHVQQELLRPHLTQADSSSHDDSFHTARTSATTSPMGIMSIDLSSTVGCTNDSSKTFHLPINRQNINGESRNWSTGHNLRTPPNWTPMVNSHHPLKESHPRTIAQSQSNVQKRSQSYPTTLHRNMDHSADRLGRKHVDEPKVARAAEVYNSDSNLDNRLQASAEDVNNLVYQQIRAENAHRHSTIMNGGAMPVGIIFPPAEKEKTLKRTAKHESLREDSGIDNQSITQSPDPHHEKTEQALDTLSHGQPIRSNRSRAPVPAADASAIKVFKTRQRPNTGDDHLHRQHTLRRSRGENQLRRPDTSDGASLSKDLPLRSASDSRPQAPGVQKSLRHFSHGAKLENNAHVRRTSLEIPHSPRKSLDVRHLQASTTPMSNSQLSDRTEVEVCEARGVAIFPHNNKSVLIVDSGSRPSSKHTENSSPTSVTSSPKPKFNMKDTLEFTALVTEPQTPPSLQKELKPNADSPLVNPRAAPEPPAFRVIPPTPNDELESLFDQVDIRPQRRQSLIQKARRYSESFVQPLFIRSNSLRKQTRRMSINDDERPTNLSPMWKPRGFWDGIDSDEDYMDDYGIEVYPPRRLDNGSVTQKLTFPRNMSVRMPGFRGTGGFHLGNSLGLDRHGSNNRRHVVRMRTSEELLRQAAARRRRFSLPGSGLGASFTAMRVSKVHSLRDRLNEFMMQNEEKKREKRREILRGQIQHAR